MLALLGGVLLLGVFVATEARSAQPLMPLWLFTDRDRAAACLGFFLGPAAMMSMFFFLTQFLQDIRGHDALTTGFAFLPMAGGMFTMTRVVPALLGRFGPRPLALAGTALMVTGQLRLAQLTPASGYLTGLLPPMLLLVPAAGWRSSRWCRSSSAAFHKPTPARRAACCRPRSRWAPRSACPSW